MFEELDWWIYFGASIVGYFPAKYLTEIIDIRWPDKPWVVAWRNNVPLALPFFTTVFWLWVLAGNHYPNFIFPILSNLSPAITIALGLLCLVYWLMPKHSTLLVLHQLLLLALYFYTTSGLWQPIGGDWAGIGQLLKLIGMSTAGYLVISLLAGWLRSIGVGAKQELQNNV
jgi:hypothetical protein